MVPTEEEGEKELGALFKNSSGEQTLAILIREALNWTVEDAVAAQLKAIEPDKSCRLIFRPGTNSSGDRASHDFCYSSIG